MIDIDLCKALKKILFLYPPSPVPFLLQKDWEIKVT